MGTWLYGSQIDPRTHTKGRCRPCRRAYVWPLRDRVRVYEARCPRCGHHLDNTSRQLGTEFLLVTGTELTARRGEEE